MSDEGEDAATPGRMRVDKWLWQARFFKSRTLAGKSVSGGGLRINRQPVRKAHQPVGPGDILTFPQGRLVRVIEIVALGARRGPAAEAQTLYRDLDPPASPTATKDPVAPTGRDPGTGRPTKRERRATDRLKIG